MTTEQETARIVRAWLADGVTVLPDRVLDEVLERVPATPQVVRPWWLGRRLRRLDGLRVLSAAAGLVAIVVAVRLLAPVGTGTPGSRPIPTALPTPAATSSPSPTPPPLPEPTLAEVPAAGPLEGTYVVNNVDGHPIRVTFTVPAGWTSCCGGWVEKNGTGPPNGMAFWPWVLEHIYPDPCDRSAGAIPVGPTVADLVSAVRAQTDRRPTTPTPVTVAGFRGQELEWSVPSDADFTACTGGDYISWYGGSNSNATRFHQAPDQVDHLRVLDVDGTTLTIMTAFFPVTSAADRAELDGIIRSLRIEKLAVGPSAAPSPSPESSPSPAP